MDLCQDKHIVNLFLNHTGQSQSLAEVGKYYKSIKYLISKTSV